MYNSGDLKYIIEKIKCINIEEEGMLIIGGDFNIRIGNLGGFEGLQDKEDLRERKNKDTTISNEGRSLIEVIQSKVWYILNGQTIGDADGNFTYAGARGNSVIDYVIVNDKAWKVIEDFKIEDRVDSGHIPLKVEIIDRHR